MHILTVRKRYQKSFVVQIENLKVLAVNRLKKGV